ncbi:hypothetical protein [Brucella rhizosphaerae]|uniref:Uncharacterized protein n=1 Tax=Brucella rhizosphaerae TaxID=571254 RepID=A0A256FEC6_9HYPH|nr:hypothetical protein [Brucella rhizosphaerae]OYR12801.1 hypothetical protein CEV32_0975 [Brucella rhizosphaerae]
MLVTPAIDKLPIKPLEFSGGFCFYCWNKMTVHPDETVVVCLSRNNLSPFQACKIARYGLNSLNRLDDFGKKPLAEMDFFIIRCGWWGIGAR